MRLRRCGTVALFAALAAAAFVHGQTVVDHSGPVQPQELADAKAWFDERLAVMSSRSAPVAEPAIRSISQGWGKFQFGRNVNRNPLKLNGKTYPNGFGSHAPAVVELTMPAGSARLTGVCGVDDTENSRPAKHAIIFTIEADGREVFRSGRQTADLDPAAFDLDLKGVQKVTLKCEGTGDYTYTPVDWNDLRLTAADGRVTSLGVPPAASIGQGGCFDFTFDGHPSSELLAGWTFRRESLPEQADRTGERLTWADPKTGVETSVSVTRYTRYPVVEWVQSFRNTGAADSPMLENVNAMSLLLPTADDKLILHHNTGDYESDDGYAPHVTDLLSNQPLHFHPTGGRPSDRVWPYFNIENSGQKRGQIIAVGWPGQWSADFTRTDDAGGRLHVRAGQETLKVRLHPGESIRTPLNVVMFYRGDVTRSQNLWRRWMIDCNTPRPNGQLPPNIFASSMGLWQSEKTETDAIKLFASQKVPLTHWWMDAGWYPCPKNQWWHVGTWDPDPQRFPNGVKAVSEVAHANHMQLILWLEPERSHNGSWLDKNHPKWLLTAKGEADNKLLDLGNPDAWRWLVDKIDSVLVSQGVDLYRQDFNIAPLQFWQAKDTPDRQGVTEMRHIEGYLALWDELHRRHPNLLIDTCASGGRRLDLETLRRSVPLWRSDDSENPEANQAITYGLAEWLPYYGSGVGCDTPYVIRSQMHPFLAFGLPHTPGRAMDWDLYHREMSIWQTICADLSGDYYPLLPYRMDRDSWMAWQFDRPELGRGVVQAFRRPDSAYAAARFKLRGLDPAAQYRVTDLDHPDHVKTLSGRELADNGLDIQLNSAPSAAVLTYVKQQ
ncbi:MAG: Alpha-galactosidase [Phycisphaerales bacterium]|nr:Alpha-galactosidase [Phycisphaerales bacterium]